MTPGITARSARGKTMKTLFVPIIAGCALAAVAASAQPAGTGTGATAQTAGRNQALLATLPLDDVADVAAVKRGLIEAFPALLIKTEDGRTVRDNRQWAFLDDPSPRSAPATVNPSLWRNATLNASAGLFRVVDHVYQVRGFDGAVMSIIEGDTGVIVVDPLGNAETAAAGMALYFRHRPNRPVLALVYTHPHGDHYGGAGGVVKAADVTAGKVQVIAPKGFIDSVLSEWVLAGPLMARRAIYMTGLMLPPGPEGLVDAGIGKASGFGTTALIAPTREIEQAAERVVLDGVTFDFRVAREVEAPSELTFYLPQYKALCLAELANQSMHQLVSVRGTRVRDALAWADHLRAAARDYGVSMDAVFVSHGWPHWEDAAAYVENQADIYQYVHDQTLRMANEGLTPDEIADRLKLPPELAGKWYDRGYYGNVAHNARAVYQFYFSWFDGNPSNLDPLPPEEAAVKYVAAMGGADKVLALARTSYAAGDYRWTIELLKQAVFADPANKPARTLAAQAMRQIGYAAESALWRNYYLSGAYELDHGSTQLPAASLLDQYASILTAPMIFRTMAVRVDPAAAGGRTIEVPLTITDSGDHYALRVHNAVLTFARTDTAPAGGLALSRASLIAILSGRKTLADEAAAARPAVRTAMAQLLAVLSPVSTDIPLVLPAPH